MLKIWFKLTTLKSLSRIMTILYFNSASLLILHINVKYCRMAYVVRHLNDHFVPHPAVGRVGNH